jgi:hypothetical protein
MPNWKRILVGDAFLLPSTDFDYYRDSVLVWPFVLFSIAGVVNLFTRGINHEAGIEYSAMAIAAILAARERIILLGAALGFCTWQSSISFGLKHEWSAFAIAVLTGSSFVFLVRAFADYKPTYQVARGLTMVGLILSASSLGITLLLFRVIR